MKIELKKIKYSPELSEETNAFTAQIWVNGIFCGTASNRGHGGCTELNPNIDKLALWKAAGDYVKNLPSNTIIPQIPSNTLLSLDDFVDELIDRHVNELELKKAIGTIKKKAKTAILVALKAELDSFLAGNILELRYNQYSIKNISKLPRNRQTELMLELKRNAEHNLQDGEVILNDSPLFFTS